MELIESKSLLAKLMATENLIVEQRQVPTAMFDVKNRILTLPILDNNSHEVKIPTDASNKELKEKLEKELVDVLFNYACANSKQAALKVFMNTCFG